MNRSLWHHRDFDLLWGGQTISKIGTEISTLALPLIAIHVLHATTFEVGALTAVEFLPFLLVGLPAGAWVDRMRRRRVLMVADIGRFMALGSIPLAHSFATLTLVHLFVVAFVTGVLTVFFDVAYQSYLPELVERGQLVDGNAKLATTESGAQLVGPTLAGGLIDVVGPALAVIADAASFAISAIAVLGIRKPEPVEDRAAPEQRLGMRREIAEGLGYVLRHRLLRPIAFCTATSNLFSGMQAAVITVYMVRTLGMSPGLIGVTFALGNIGFLVGAVLSPRVVRLFGVGPTIIWSILLSGIGGLLTPLATPAVAIPWLVAGTFFYAAGGPVYNINQVSLRQAITPHRLQGRMNASMRFVVWGTLPLGSLA